MDFVSVHKSVHFAIVTHAFIAKVIRTEELFLNVSAHRNALTLGVNVMLSLFRYDLSVRWVQHVLTATSATSVMASHAPQCLINLLWVCHAVTLIV